MGFDSGASDKRAWKMAIPTFWERIWRRSLYRGKYLRAYALFSLKKQGIHNTPLENKILKTYKNLCGYH